jgi:DoxX-like family
VLLAAAFVGHSYGMLRPNEQLRRGGMVYVLEMPAGLRVFAGVAEGLGGVALVVPPFIHVLAWLTPLAAVGLVVLMLGAMVLHVQRKEYPNLVLNGVLLVLAAVVAWGRIGPYPF